MLLQSSCIILNDNNFLGFNSVVWKSLVYTLGGKFNQAKEG
jgi:hypothetical protein